MLHLPLRTVKFFINEFEKNFLKYSVETHIINEFEKVVILNDDLVLYIGILLENSSVGENIEEHYSWTKNCKFMDMPEKGKDYYVLIIEELTYNSLGFKYNHSFFTHKMEEETGIKYISLDLRYSKFQGFSSSFDGKYIREHIEEIDKLLPDIKLRERHKSWIGIKYNYIIFEVDSVDGNTEYAVGYTTQNPRNYIDSNCRSLLNQGTYFTLNKMKQSDSKFKDAFQSWKGKTRKYRLENHFRYFYLEKYFKEKDDAYDYCYNLLQDAYDNKFLNKEKNTYLAPINKWTSEELVYKLTKKLYKDYPVIYQHRPFFLKGPNGGQMSYDIFISSLNIAIEYQGKQHFEPVEFFGGEEGYKKTVERDILKNN